MLSKGMIVLLIVCLILSLLCNLYQFTEVQVMYHYIDIMQDAIDTYADNNASLLDQLLHLKQKSM